MDLYHLKAINSLFKKIKKTRYNNNNNSLKSVSDKERRTLDRETAKGNDQHDATINMLCSGDSVIWEIHTTESHY